MTAAPIVAKDCGKRNEDCGEGPAEAVPFPIPHGSSISNAIQSLRWTVKSKNGGLEAQSRSQNPTARSQQPRLPHASDQNNYSRPHHGQVGIVALQGFDRSVVSCGNRGQSFSRLHRMTLHVSGWDRY